MYLGQVALVGASVGVPVGNWALVYGTIVEICPSVCHAVIRVDDEEVVVEKGKVQLVDVNLAGSTLIDMDESKRAVFHTLWANYWIALQVKVDGVWEDIPEGMRQVPFSELQDDAELRVKPSDEMLKVKREETLREIHELKQKRAASEEMVQKLAAAIQQIDADKAALQESLANIS